MLEPSAFLSDCFKNLYNLTMA